MHAQTLTQPQMTSETHRLGIGVTIQASLHVPVDTMSLSSLPISIKPVKSECGVVAKKLRSFTDWGLM